MSELVSYYNKVSERVHLLKKQDPGQLAAMVELGELLDLVTPVNKYIGKVDEDIKALLKRVMGAHNVQSWETGCLNITPVFKSVPTKQCEADPEWKSACDELKAIEVRAAELKAIQKELMGRDGYSTQVLSHYARKERTL